MMNVTVYDHSSQLPDLPPTGRFFHSRQLMEVYEHTPRHRPFMAVATDGGRPVAWLLAAERSRRSWMPPYLYRHVIMLGEGSYATDENRNMLFAMMLDALTRRLQHRTLYMEVSLLSQKMFGYAPLRAAGYFPVRWMNIHNSLHSRTPEERISPRQMKRIRRALHHGVTTMPVGSDQDFRDFMRLLRHHNWLKPRRYVPDERYFQLLMQQQRCTLFLTRHGDRCIGCSCLVYADGDAYLWFSASLRKRYARLHPNAVTFWNTIQYAHKNGCQHIRFSDVGLPFRRNPYRDFILSFGGKEVSTFRWFRISIRWVNRVASWLWRP